LFANIEKMDLQGFVLKNLNYFDFASYSDKMCKYGDAV